MNENRIYCIEVSGECQYLMYVNRPALAFLCGGTQGLYCTKNTAWKPITKDACKNCKEGRYQGLTREQAIEKIAKALCRTDGADCTICSFNSNKKGCKKYLETERYITQAKAVLEDILGGYDDER